MNANSSASWTCKACTFLNENGHGLACIMCSTERNTPASTNSNVSHTYSTTASAQGQDIAPLKKTKTKQTYLTAAKNPSTAEQAMPSKTKQAAAKMPSKAKEAAAKTPSKAKQANEQANAKMPPKKSTSVKTSVPNTNFYVNEEAEDEAEKKNNKTKAIDKRPDDVMRRENYKLLDVKMKNSSLFANILPGGMGDQVKALPPNDMLMMTKSNFQHKVPDADKNKVKGSYANDNKMFVTWLSADVQAAGFDINVVTPEELYKLPPFSKHATKESGENSLNNTIGRNHEVITHRTPTTLRCGTILVLQFIPTSFNGMPSWSSIETKIEKDPTALPAFREIAQKATLNAQQKATFSLASVNEMAFVCVSLAKPAKRKTDDKKWIAKFTELKQYKKDKGKFPTNGEKGIGNWCKHQRKAIHNEKLSAERLSMLKGIGFTVGKKKK